jgi:hypothetical protein
MYATVGICVLIDTIRHRRLHPALAWSGALTVAINIITHMAQTADQRIVKGSLFGGGSFL